MVSSETLTRAKLQIGNKHEEILDITSHPDLSAPRKLNGREGITV